MDNRELTDIQEMEMFPAIVVNIINPLRVVFNRGTLHSIKIGQRFLLYKLSEEEIKDPISKESLGFLEIPKGTGKVIHVQEKISTIESDRTEPSEQTIVRRRTTPFLPPMEETVTTPSNRMVPFDSPEIGDKVKPL